MKIMFVILVFFTVTTFVGGCGEIERTTAGLTGYSQICVDGVSYLQFTSGATVEYNTDGTIKLCSKN